MSAKKDIETLLNNGQLNEGRKLLDDYAALYPSDMDTLCMYCMYYIMTDDYETALKYALKTVREYPTNGDAYYNLGYVYSLLGNTIESAKNYVICSYIYEYNKDPKFEELGIQDLLTHSANEVSVLEESLLKNPSISILPLLKQIQEYYNGVDYVYGFNCNIFRTSDSIAGDYYYFPKDERYISYYNVSELTNAPQCGNVFQSKFNLLHADLKKEYHISTADTSALLPIATVTPCTQLQITENGVDYTIIPKYEKQFNYYNMKGDISVSASENCYFGKPVLLKQHPGSKKLVLNIFVDGLPFSVLKDMETFKNYMPYTFAFFSEGTICTNAFSNSEWTYPSVGSIASGLDSTEHMMLNPNITAAIPSDITTLAEYFHEQGYYTQMIGGNWRIVPPYGHSRGYDQYIYQHGYTGLTVENIVTDTINQLQTFQDTNQFMWITLMDLHQVADDLNLPVYVQKNLSLEQRQYMEKGKNSVKQSYNAYKREKMLYQMKYIDYQLHILYSYIEEHYNDNDIIISLFSDHGQSYLANNPSSPLNNHRTNMSMMFRGSEFPTGICDELISGTDYLPIMCHSANIPLKEYETISGKLPLFFGGQKEKEYTITEIIYPGDPYRACIRKKGITFYFENTLPTQPDCRFVLADDYKMWLESDAGERIEDPEQQAYFTDIILSHIAKLRIYG